MPARSPPRTPRTREAAKRETREALLDAGVAEFVEHGLDSPSLDAICARAGYTRGAFYVHFRDREDFLVAVGERVLGSFVDAVIATDDQAHDLERTVTRFLCALAPAAEEPERRRRGGGPLAGMQVHRLLEACARSPEIRGRLVGLVQLALGRVAQVVASGQAARAVRRDVEAQPAATLLVSAAIGVLTAVEMGLPLDFDSLRVAVRTLLAAPRGLRSAT
jgi:TetR/AcrR family transcriptional repressor of nem operon